MSDKSQAKLSKTALRIVTQFYPRSFRDRFAAEIAQTFSDMIDDVADSGRSILLITVASLYDASVGVAQEWTKELVGTMFTIRSATGFALLLFAPFVLLIGLSFFNVAPSWLTSDGQQLTNVGRVFVFGSVLLLPVSMIANIGGMLSIQRDGKARTFLPSRSRVLLLAVQAIAVITIGAWMIGESINCAAGVCD